MLRLLYRIVKIVSIGKIIKKQGKMHFENFNIL